MLWNFDPFEPLVTQMSRVPAFVPATDVTVSDGDLVLTMDVPGLSDQDLSIELQDGYLTVRGERRQLQAEGAHLAHRERTFGRFERRVKVPDGIEPDAITASLTDGVLSLIVPKPDRMKPKAISIATSGETHRLEAGTGAVS